MIWGEFGIYLILIVFSGWKLSVYADKLCEAKNLGRGLVGFILLGFTTSIPELITTMTSVIFIGNPSLGAGNIIGSNNANMFILFVSMLTVTTLLNKGKPNLQNLGSVAYLLVIVGVFVAGVSLDGSLSFMGFSVFGYLIILLFFLSIFGLKNGEYKDENNEKPENMDVGTFFYVKLTVYAALLVFVSWRISFVVDSMAVTYSWSSTSAGALFLAWATSLPELVVTVSAVIMGAKELGIGNIMGSNIFNMMILALADIFSGKDSQVFKHESDLLFLTGMLTVMSGALLIMLSSGKNKKIFGITLIPAIMIVLYVAGMVYSF
jgi:cation:H+ antiporter